MSNTPYRDLETEDILSGHLSGIQSDINKMQDVLNMETSSRSGHSLVPVTDQDDASLRYRIYEGTVRNWVDTPSPIIYRDGSVVDEKEYELQAPYGLIVFYAQQSSDNSITADFDHINSESKIIKDINSNISNVNDDMNDINNNIDTVNDNINDIEKELSDISDSGVVLPLDPTIQSEIVNTMPSYSVDDLISANDVLMGGDTIDAMPIYVKTRSTITKLRVDVSGSSSEHTMNMGIYSNVDAKPDELLGETGDFTTVASNNMTKSLKSSVVLDVGVYWVARYQSGGVYLQGHELDEVKLITVENASNVNGSGTVFGVRTVTGAVDVSEGLPDTFPSINGSDAEYLSRSEFGTVYAIK